MMNSIDRESELINHVWKECQQSATGNAIFHCEALAKEYLEKDKGLMDAWVILKTLPELKISCTSHERTKDFCEFA